jgi:uncharacterized protein YbbC (DUF1343 family)
VPFHLPFCLLVCLLLGGAAAWAQKPSAAAPANPAPAPVRLGIDLLAGENFAALRALTPGRKPRLGLVANQSSLDSAGRRTIDVLAQAKSLRLVAIFAPEHGLTARKDTLEIGAERDAATGTAIHGVYGATEASRRPKEADLDGLDAIVFDLQDAGVRWYTYETTLGYFLEACARRGIALVVLDRPNPLGGERVEGPVSAASIRSFTNYFPLPVRHGMTLGELAELFNSSPQGEGPARLIVVRMRGWHRTMLFAQTGLRWTPPSPNLRSPEEALLYPALSMIEGTNVSVGRGTETPFEVLGAPWIDGRRLTEALRARRISGIRVETAEFTPVSSNFAGKLCHGVRLQLTDGARLDSPRLGLELAAALHRLYPEKFEMAKMATLLAEPGTLERLQKGEEPEHIAARWQEAIAAFLRQRSGYLFDEYK